MNTNLRIDPKVEPNVGGHHYPGCETNDEFFTSDCAYGCGCWMGSSRSGGPDGVNPFGACPARPPRSLSMDIGSRRSHPR